MPLQIEQRGSGPAEIVQEEYAADRWAGRPLYEIEAWSLLLEVPDRDDSSAMKVLLDNVSFKALPGDMIALMGPSGAGKTTLLLALNGYLPPSNGIVRINGEDLYNIYDNLRGSIGYVPQDDLVHAELTVFEAVKYSAKFRLPPDYSEDEIDARVEQTIKDLGLEGVKNLQIGRPEKKVLSGGQRKRVNIALELVTNPVILFLDEPTSGLAADDTTALITLLSDLTKQTGKTIIMTIHQPAKDKFEKFTHCLVMGYGGVPMFFGPTKDCYRFFGTWKERHRLPNNVDNPRDMFEMIAQRERPIHDAMRAQDPNGAARPRAEAGRHQVAPGVREPAEPRLPQDVLRPPRDRQRTGPARLARDPRENQRAARPAPVALLQGQGARPQRDGDHAPAGADHRRAPGGRLRQGGGSEYPRVVPRRAAARPGAGRSTAEAHRHGREHGGHLLPGGGGGVVRHLERRARNRLRAEHLPARADGEPGPRQLRPLEVPLAGNLLRPPSAPRCSASSSSRSASRAAGRPSGKCWRERRHLVQRGGDGEASICPKACPPPGGRARRRRCRGT